MPMSSSQTRGARSSSGNFDKDLRKPVDILKLLQQHFNCSPSAAHGLVAHGHVSIDGHTIHGAHVRRWTGYQLYGRMLRAGQGREARILGSRLVRDLEQLTLDGQ